MTKEEACNLRGKKVVLLMPCTVVGDRVVAGIFETLADYPDEGALISDSGLILFDVAEMWCKHKHGGPIVIGNTGFTYNRKRLDMILDGVFPSLS